MKIEIIDGAGKRITDGSTIVPQFDMNVKKLKGMDIIGADGKKIGEIDKVLADSSNQPKAVTVDAGGLLGIGGHEVIVPFDQLQKSTDKDFKVSLSKEQVKNLEKFDAKASARGDVATGVGGQYSTSIPARQFRKLRLATKAARPTRELWAGRFS